MARPLLVKGRVVSDFKNDDFDIEDQHSGGREKVFKDAELEALLQEDSCQTQQEFVGYIYYIYINIIYIYIYIYIYNIQISFVFRDC